MDKLLVCLVVICWVSPPKWVQVPTGLPAGETASTQTGSQATIDSIEQTLEGPVKARDIAAASTWVSGLGITEWMGPLAPIAISPFFGVACLSGLSLWGPQWVTEGPLLGAAGPLQNEWLFCAFAGLALATSLPRLTKVSKPAAQVLDQLETYSVIVILLVVKLVLSAQAADSGGEMIAGGTVQMPIAQLGMVSFTLDTLLAMAMIVNLIVVSSVKFFFEFLVWLTPIPLLDAIFEFCSKATCAGLMAIYALSPTAATVINFLILGISLLLFRWVKRRTHFYRTMIVDPIVSKVWSRYAVPQHDELIVFSQSDLGPFKAKTRLKLTRIAEGGWQLKDMSWLGPKANHSIAPETRLRFVPGWILHTIEWVDESDQVSRLRLSRRFSGDALAGLLDRLGIIRPSESAGQPTADRPVSVAEFA